MKKQATELEMVIAAHVITMAYTIKHETPSDQDRVGILAFTCMTFEKVQSHTFLKSHIQ